MDGAEPSEPGDRLGGGGAGIAALPVLHRGIGVDVRRHRRVGVDGHEVAGRRIDGGDERAPGPGLADEAEVEGGAAAGEHHPLGGHLDVRGEAVDAVATGRAPVEDRLRPGGVADRVVEVGEPPGDHREAGAMGAGDERGELVVTVEAVLGVGDPHPDLAKPGGGGAVDDRLGLPALGAVVLPDPHPLPAHRGERGRRPGGRRRRGQRRLGDEDRRVPGGHVRGRRRRGGRAARHHQAARGHLRGRRRRLGRGGGGGRRGRRRGGRGRGRRGRGRGKRRRRRQRRDRGGADRVGVGETVRGRERRAERDRHGEGGRDQGLRARGATEMGHGFSRWVDGAADSKVPVTLHEIPAARTPGGIRARVLAGGGRYRPPAVLSGPGGRGGRSPPSRRPRPWSSPGGGARGCGRVRGSCRSG